jgi:hypothetical protein
MPPVQFVVLLDNDLSAVNRYEAVIGKHLEARGNKSIALVAFTSDDPAEAFIRENASEIVACVQDIKRVGFGGAWFLENVIARYIPDVPVFIVSSMGKFLKLGAPGKKQNECFYYSKPPADEELKEITEAVVSYATKRNRRAEA